MTLAAIVGAALALVDGEPVLDLVWVPADPHRRNTRASCYVRLAGGWLHLYGQVGRVGLGRSRKTDPWHDEEDYSRRYQDIPWPPWET